MVNLVAMRRLDRSGGRERYERLAGLIGSDQNVILAAYARRLAALRDPGIDNPRAHDEELARATEILTEVAAAIQCDSVPSVERYGAPAEAGPLDTLRASTLLFEAFISTLADQVRRDPELLPSFIASVLAMNEHINIRMRKAVLAYSGNLIERIDLAHREERLHIARDLHDRLGESVSVAFRQLELHEITTGIAADAIKESLVEAMHRLRVTMSDLRQDSVRSLESAILGYIDSVAPDPDVRIRINGDEACVPGEIINESFLVIKEAIRNALHHGRPATVLIAVTLSPDELRARVEDDGRGFLPGQLPCSASSGNGLASMRERAGLMGGRLMVSSRPGRGTLVQLRVPLPGRLDD